jgi:hypothetical protein
VNRKKCDVSLMLASRRRMLKPKEVAMNIVKLHRYGVRARSDGSPCLALEARKAAQVASPRSSRAELRASGVRGVSIAALASCYERTVVAIAAYKGMPLPPSRSTRPATSCERTGYHQPVRARRRAGDRRGTRAHEAEHIAELAHERCLVESALDVPVHLSVEARAASTAAVLA